MKSFFITLTFFAVITTSVFSQNKVNADMRSHIKYPENVNTELTSNERDMIYEVYQSEMETLVLGDKTFLKDLKHLLRNRILIYEETNVRKQKKCKLLSEIPLFNAHNKNLKYDTSYDKSSFNPLKYKLDFFGKGTYVYRIDNTNYFIQITSQYRQ